MVRFGDNDSAEGEEENRRRIHVGEMQRRVKSEVQIRRKQKREGDGVS